MKELLGLVVISLAQGSATDFVSLDSAESEEAEYLMSFSHFLMHRKGHELTF